MPYHAYTLDQRPDFRRDVGRVNYAAWPVFMLEDPVANEHWDSLFTRFAPFQFVLCDEQETVIAAGNAIPVVWDGTIQGLPAGWDAVLEQGVRDREQGRPANTLSALSITVEPQQQGRGISRLMVQTMRSIAAAHGFKHLIAPVRPSLKSRYPLTPIQRYVEWQLPDGAPFDPWLRVHWRLGARILKIAARSMVIPGTVAEWEEWAQMRFPESDAYVVPGALEPVQIDRHKNQGVYVEPNVWMYHALDVAANDAP
jgi:GNAT superfamily N-acetyltransferase